MGNNKWVHIISFALVIIGGLNWGLVGLLNIDLVAMIFGGTPFIQKIVYILVGLAALVLIFTHKKDCKVCGGMGSGTQGRM